MNGNANDGSNPEHPLRARVRSASEEKHGSRAAVDSTYEVPSAVAIGWSTVRPYRRLESECTSGSIASVQSFGATGAAAPVPNRRADYSRFDVPEEQANADVRTLIHELEAAGLLRRPRNECPSGDREQFSAIGVPSEVLPLGVPGPAPRRCRRLRAAVPCRSRFGSLARFRW